MKKVFTFLFLSFLAIGLFAQDEEKAKLTIFSEDGDKFWLIIEGEKINEEAQYKVSEAPAGTPMTRVKIIFKDSKLPSVDRSFFTADSLGNPLDRTYKIKRKKNGKYVIRHVSTRMTVETTVYEETVNGEATGQTSNGITNESFNNATTTTTTQTKETNNPPHATGLNVSINVDENGESGSINMNVNETASNTNMTTTTTTMTTTTTTSTGSVGNTIIAPNPNAVEKPAKPERPNPLPGYNGPVGCDYPMSQQSFNAAKNSVASKTFDDSKVTVAKQVIKNNCMLTSQVKSLINLLTFENDKLELAKFAYQYTYDKGNYYQINEVFDFNSSVDELDSYISSH